MASPVQDADLAAVSSGSSSDERTHDPEVELTTSREDTNTRTSTVCQWRTSQFYDQECLRFFDCPSHVVERRLSEDLVGGTPNTGEAEIRDREGPSERPSSSNFPEQVSSTFSSPPVDGEREPTASQGIPARSQTVGSSLVRPQDRELPPNPSTQSAEPDRGVSRQSSTPNPARWRSQPGILRQPSSDPSEGPSGSQTRPDAAERRTNRRSVVISEPIDDLNALRLTRTRSNGDNNGHSAGIYVRQQRSREPQADPHESADEEGGSGFALPRWQPDAEVTYCPICRNQFSIFVRKHHCRKCGRVVCASCSPHRIIIPHHFIVRAPGYELPASQNLLLDGLVTTYGLPGGERVRLCNPCVPDPNIAPPQSPPNARNGHSRSRSGVTTGQGGYGRFSVMHTTSESQYRDRYYTPRSRSITMNSPVPGAGSANSPHSSRHGSERYRSGSVVPGGPSSYPARIGSLSGAPSSSRRRALPPRPLIPEEDECPVCHLELPPRSLPDYETLRENHITTCILDHSQYGNSPRRANISGGGEGSAESPPATAPRRTGMYTYPATEKDCIDDAECTICLEEFTVGIPMARLECLCRFHRSCIAAWFVNHPGRCPVHQHDGFGY